MASSSNLIEQSFTCSICKELYLNPYLLKSCGHSFCSRCLGPHFDVIINRSATNKQCPSCGSKASMHETVPNRALEEVCFHYRQNIHRLSSNSSSNGNSGATDVEILFDTSKTNNNCNSNSNSNSNSSNSSNSNRTIIGDKKIPCYSFHTMDLAKVKSLIKQHTSNSNNVKLDNVDKSNDKSDLEDIFKKFSFLYNSQIGSKEPMSLEEVIKEVNRSRKCAAEAAGFSNQYNQKEVNDLRAEKCKISDRLEEAYREMFRKALISRNKLKKKTKAANIIAQSHVNFEPPDRGAADEREGGSASEPDSSINMDTNMSENNGSDDAILKKLYPWVLVLSETLNRPFFYNQLTKLGQFKIPDAIKSRMLELFPGGINFHLDNVEAGDSSNSNSSSNSSSNCSSSSSSSSSQSIGLNTATATTTKVVTFDTSSFSPSKAGKFSASVSPILTNSGSPRISSNDSDYSDLNLSSTQVNTQQQAATSFAFNLTLTESQDSQQLQLMQSPREYFDPRNYMNDSYLSNASSGSPPSSSNDNYFKGKYSNNSNNSMLATPSITTVLNDSAIVSSSHNSSSSQIIGTSEAEIPFTYLSQFELERKLGSTPSLNQSQSQINQNSMDFDDAVDKSSIISSPLKLVVDNINTNSSPLNSIIDKIELGLSELTDAPKAQQQDNTMSTELTKTVPGEGLSPAPSTLHSMPSLPRGNQCSSQKPTQVLNLTTSNCQQRQIVICDLSKEDDVNNDEVYFGDDTKDHASSNSQIVNSPSSSMSQSARKSPRSCPQDASKPSTVSSYSNSNSNCNSQDISKQANIITLQDDDDDNNNEKEKSNKNDDDNDDFVEDTNVKSMNNQIKHSQQQQQQQQQQQTKKKKVIDVQILDVDDSNDISCIIESDGAGDDDDFESDNNLESVTASHHNKNITTDSNNLKSSQANSNSAKVKDDSVEGWSCNMCTLINLPKAKYCAVCQTPGPVQSNVRNTRSLISSSSSSSSSLYGSSNAGNKANPNSSNVGTKPPSNFNNNSSSNARKRSNKEIQQSSSQSSSHQSIFANSNKKSKQ